MNIDLALLADAATVDAAGKLNILGVFDTIGARRFPLKHPRLAIVLRFDAGMEDAGEHAVVVRLAGPDGQEVLSLNGTIQLGPGPGVVGGRMRVPHILNLDGLVFGAPGRYAFQVTLDGAAAVEIPLHVRAPGPAPGTPMVEA